MRKHPENEGKITPEMTLKFNRILQQVLSYVYYELSDEQRALLATHCKTLYPEQVKHCTALLTDDFNEFIARKVFMELMLHSRYDKKVDEYIDQKMRESELGL